MCIRDSFLAFERCVYQLKNLHNVNRFQECIDDIRFWTKKFFYNFNGRKIFSPVFSFNDFKILQNLRRDESIVVCRPDKGKGVVIVDKTSYIEKIQQILSDSSKSVSYTHLT